MRVAAWFLLGCTFIVSRKMSCVGQAVAVPTYSASKTVAEVSFQFEHPALPVPRFMVKLREDGVGRYEVEQAERAATSNSMRGEEARHIDRTMQLQPETVTKIFKEARELNYFDRECASKAKNIADTGKKILSYTGADGRGSCAYNYSDDKRVMKLANTFLAIAYTMDEGRKLEFLHRYDRLGLDAEMNTLTQEAAAGRALELGTISQTLTEIAGDMAVMQRVRQRAERLLAEIN
jgi:hypothetical protein